MLARQSFFCCTVQICTLSLTRDSIDRILLRLKWIKAKKAPLALTENKSYSILLNCGFTEGMGGRRGGGGGGGRREFMLLTKT